MSKNVGIIAIVNVHTDNKVCWAASLVCPGTEFAMLMLHGNTALPKKSWE